MRRRLAENVLFFREYLRNFHSTGAILPSGRFLAAPSRGLSPAIRFAWSPEDFLEVGPGTGAVTRRIIPAMRRTDSLDLVELNETFVRQLQGRFETEPMFQAVADRARVLHCPVEELPHDRTYDVIVSGLPLNNFSATVVEQILAALVGLLAPGGMLSFFEYIAVRRARALVSGRTERRGCAAWAGQCARCSTLFEIRRDAVWLNVPPAWVHHVQRQPQETR